MHASSLPAEPEGPALGPSPMVLIVEDETSLAMAERRTLERAGYRVQTAIDVPQARRALDSDDIGLVLLDYMLPGDKGSDLVTELGERLETLPVIMVTGYADVDLAVGMLKAGVADYLVKDSSLRFLRELPETVAATLERFEAKTKTQDLRAEAEHYRALLDSVSRELRPTMDQMLGATEGLLEDPEASAASGQRLKELHAMGRRLVELVNGLLGDPGLAPVAPRSVLPVESISQGQVELRGRVLLAEDNRVSQTLITFYLEEVGLEVETADDGESAVERALAAEQTGSPFDLILMDIGLPRIDGYEATARLRGAGFSRPIIALSAHAGPARLRRSLEAGCDDHLTKVAGDGALLDALAGFLPRAN